MNSPDLSAQPTSPPPPPTAETIVGSAGPAPQSRRSTSRVATPGAFTALYRLVLRHQITRARLVLFVAITGLSLLVSWALSRSSQRIPDTVEFGISGLGLGLIVPVVALVLGSATIGTWVEDETLVYVWLRPVSRWLLALAATLAAATVALPATLIPLTAMALIGSGGDADVITATVISTALGSLAYVSLFVAAGLVVRRALLWGLVYVLIWEFFVARAGAGAAQLSINSYAASLLSNYSDQDLPLADRSVSSSYIALIGVTVAAVAFTTWRLNRSSVD